jgi:hypothetical protein
MLNTRIKTRTYRRVRVGIALGKVWKDIYRPKSPKSPNSGRPPRIADMLGIVERLRGSFNRSVGRPAARREALEETEEEVRGREEG